jgi:hypothetical protein
LRRHPRLWLVLAQLSHIIRTMVTSSIISEG